MAFYRLPIISVLTYVLLLPQSAFSAEQSEGQNSTSSGDLDVPGVSADDVTVSNIDAESYMDAVSKSEGNIDHPFRPTASDLLIQQAEEKFRLGRENFRVKDGSRARQDFDSAITLMLEASENPSDRQLYEQRMEEMVDAIHRLDLAGLGASMPVAEGPQFERAPLEDLLQMTFPVDPKLKNKVQGELTATASQLPLTMNDAVLGYINYFSGRGHRTIVAGLERAGKYRPMIERILKEEGVPLELIHLAQAESGFLPRAVSNKAATGMWQFVKFRGQQYGLNQTAYTDERLDPEMATRAAARHLKDLYNEFGDWYLAIGAYNCGPGNIQKAVERTGYADFFELRARRAIPNETTNYVPIILAMTIMTKNAKEYGLDEVTPEAPLEYDTVRMTADTNLELIGDMTDTAISQLLELNPALIKNVAPDGYSVRVPKGLGETLQASMDAVPPGQRGSWRMHRVTEGDTLAAIAKRYGSTAKSIADANPFTGGAPAPGDRLLIPAAYHATMSRPATRTVARRTTTASRPVARKAAAVHPTSTGILAQAHKSKTVAH
jgi:membrane-bound lytic murein transglycosylase D